MIRALYVLRALGVLVALYAIASLAFGTVCP